MQLKFKVTNNVTMGVCFQRWSDEVNALIKLNKGDLLQVYTNPSHYSCCQYIWETFRETEGDIGVWIGCIRDHQDNMKWVHGEEECTYFNWGSDEPGTYEDCAEMKAYWFFNGLWNDESCFTKNSVICEHSAIQPYTQVKMTCLMADHNGCFAANE